MRAWAFLLIAVAIACREPTPPTRTAEFPRGPEGYPTPDQVVENGQHVITMQGVRKAVLVAEQLYFFNQLAKVVGDTIQVTFYDEDGVYQSTLTARSGELDQETQTMIARGDVFVVGTQSTIRTQELRYDPAAHQVSSDQPTEIVQGGNVIRGAGVIADPGLKSIRITRGSAVLRSEPELGPRPVTPPEQSAEPASDGSVVPPAEPNPDGEP